MANFFGCRFRTTFNLFNPNRLLSRKIYNIVDEQKEKRTLAKLKMQYEELLSHRRQIKAERKKLDDEIIQIWTNIEKLEKIIARN